MFLFYSLSRLSSVSVVFDFSASLNDIAPLSLIPFSFDCIRMKEWVIDGDYLNAVFFCVHRLDQVE